MVHCKKKDITAILGDIIETYFVIENLDLTAIKSVVFSCAKQGLVVICPFSEIEKGYCLRIDSEDSVSLKTGFYSYDLTLEFIDGNDLTIIQGGAFNILKKRNPIKEVELIGEN